MTIESFKHFFCVAQGNTFMNAAEECNISQSSLSKSIQRLEHELGSCSSTGAPVRPS
jgi:DNA-binding transcriptional LysR family regulator